MQKIEDYVPREIVDMPPVNPSFVASSRFVELCDDLDSNLKVERSSSPIVLKIVDGMHDLIDQAKGSPFLKNYLKSEVLPKYGKQNGGPNFSALVEALKIDIPNGAYGVFDDIEAKKYELRQLHVFLQPDFIERKASIGEIGASERMKKNRQNWAESFLDYYGEPFDLESNRPQFMTRDYIQFNENEMALRRRAPTKLR